jgi:two-component system, response regulator YesN
MSITILIAEDQPHFRSGLHAIVEQQMPEYTIIGEVDNGEDAWHHISTQQPEVALLDIRMPGISGIEVAERMYSSGLDTLFVMITGYQEFHYAQSALRFGAFDFILKPCSEEEIIAVLNKAQLKVREKQVIREQLKIVGRAKLESAPHFDAVVDKITRYIDENFMNDCSVSAIAAHVYLNPTYLSTVYKKKTGIALSAYLTKVRLGQAMLLLAGTEMKITEISEATGFGEPAYFASVFKKTLGVSPSDYRNFRPNIAEE